MLETIFESNSFFFKTCVFLLMFISLLYFISCVFVGFAASKHYTKGGSGSNFLCRPKNSEWKDYTEGKSKGTGGIYGVEYEIHNCKPYSKSFLNKDMPCAVCLTARSTALMVPGKRNCFEGWHKEFSGYLMSEHDDKSRSPSEYICVDEKLDSVLGGDANNGEAIVYPVEAVCGSLKCPHMLTVENVPASYAQNK